jgi:hypothetical protein
VGTVGAPSGEVGTVGAPSGEVGTGVAGVHRALARGTKAEGEDSRV